MRFYLKRQWKSKILCVKCVSTSICGEEKMELSEFMLYRNSNMYLLVSIYNNVQRRAHTKMAHKQKLNVTWTLCANSARCSMPYTVAWDSKEAMETFFLSTFSVTAMTCDANFQYTYNALKELPSRKTSDKAVSLILSVLIVIRRLDYSNPNLKTNDVSENRMMKFNAIGHSSK